MKKTMIAIASLLLLSGACWSDDMEVNANEAKYYDNAKVVRIKTVEGEGFVQRSYDEGNEEATVNLPLFEKDTVGTTEGRLGVYLGRMNYLRLDAETIAVLEKVPQLRKTDLTVKLEQGSIYLDVENLDQEKGIEIQTPDCGIFLLDKGTYRINLVREGRTEVIVLEGIAEVAGRENSHNVRENQMIVMEGGEVGERPFYFSAADQDDFDSWNNEQSRELGYARIGTSRYLQSGYEDNEYEMSRAGRWTYMSDFNSYGWIPYNTGSDWRPYSNGRWVWNPYYGYVWTSYDTCGWFTHHYGRWHWSTNQGWCWLPSYHWSPAWVSWFGNDHYYGWSPLSWWNRPIVIINNHWDRRYDYRRGIPHHSRSTIIIRKNELSAANIHRVALNRSRLDQNAGGIISYRGAAPTARPALNKVTVINAKGRTVSYKQGGIVSGEKYRAQGSDLHSTVYKYNQDNNPVTYRKKSVESSAVKSSGSAYRSRSGEGSGSVNRVRYSPSGSSTGKSTGKTSYRSKSDGAAKTSTSSSSSSSSSSGTVKKKKGGTAYFSSSYGENSSGKAVTSAPRSQSSYSSTGTNYRSSREYRDSSTNGAYAPSASSQSSYRPVTPKTFTRREYRDNSTNGAYAPSASGQSSYRPVTPSTFTRREYRNSSSGSSYSPSSSSRSTGSSGVQRSGSSSGISHRSSSASGSSRSSGSSSSSGSSNRTAVKKK